MHRRTIWHLAMALAIVPASTNGGQLFAQAASPLSGARLPEDALGRRTFDEDFVRFDAGPDQVSGPRRHRWRTVMGYGGPAAFDNRKLTGSSVALDRDFPGVSQGRLGERPLGLDPFETQPGKPFAILARPIPPALQGQLWNARWYGGQITTKFSFSQRYGYFEVEARLPVGKGMWPQLWLLPVGGSWPLSGEIDIVEGLGDRHVIYTTLHVGQPHRQEQRKVVLPFDVSADFHRYGVLWDRQNITWYVDRHEVMKAPVPRELNQPMFLLLGLGVGGSWGGYPDAGTAFPGRLAIRRVQVWELSGS